MTDSLGDRMQAAGVFDAEPAELPDELHDALGLDNARRAHLKDLASRGEAEQPSAGELALRLEEALRERDKLAEELDATESAFSKMAKEWAGTERAFDELTVRLDEALRALAEKQATEPDDDFAGDVF